MIQDWQIKLSQDFNNQEGQNYPCSNQIVMNGFFITDNNIKLWEKFIKERNKEIDLCIAHANHVIDEIQFKNGEVWRCFKIPNYNCRGFRFYKIKIDSSISRKEVFEKILPYCNLYCKELEWI